MILPATYRGPLLLSQTLMFPLPGGFEILLVVGLTSPLASLLDVRGFVPTVSFFLGARPSKVPRFFFLLFPFFASPAPGEVVAPPFTTHPIQYPEPVLNNSILIVGLFSLVVGVKRKTHCPL